MTHDNIQLAVSSKQRFNCAKFDAKRKKTKWNDDKKKDQKSNKI